MPRVGRRGARGYKKQAAIRAAGNRGEFPAAVRPVLTSASNKVSGKSGGKSGASKGAGKVPKRKRPALAETKALQPDGIVRNGGARPGAGRPLGVPWREIERSAKSGASFDDIVKGLPSLTLEMLEDPETVEKLRSVVDAGNAAYKLSLQRSMFRKAKGGSVHAQALLARNHMGFDQQGGHGNMQAPDVAGLAGRLEELIERAAKKVHSEAAAAAAATKGKGA